MEGGPNKKRIDYFLEKVSPLLAIALILFPLFMSIISVQLTLAFLVVIYIYFIYKSISTTFLFAVSLLRFRNAEQLEWKELVKGLEDIENEIKELEKSLTDIQQYKWNDYMKDLSSIYKKLKTESKFLGSNSNLPKLLQRILFNRTKSKTIAFIKSEIESLKQLRGRDLINPTEMQHIIMIPHYKEPPSLLKETLEHLKNQTFNTKQINVVLAAEAADPDGVKVSEEIKKEYEKYFNNIWITNHVLQPYDIVGKSANMNWAGREVYTKVKEMGWDLKKTTITSCDADSKLDPQYFSYLTYKYITTERGEYKYYASAMVFYNNIWRITFYARVKNSFHSIFNAANLVRSDKLVPFSTYTTSFWVLEQIGFWDPWITPEDYHLFFKGVFKFGKYVSTVPIFLKTMSDAAEGDGHWQTIKNNYLQSRRWAWGISDGGWMIKNLIKNFWKLSIRSKYLVTHVLFDHIMGLSIAFLILLGGTLPTILNPDFNNFTSGVLFKILSERLIQFTLVFLVITVFLDFFMRPKPEKNTLLLRVMRIVEVFVQPIAAFFLTALPNLEAQTRLIFGRYLEYYVTKKKGTDGTDE